MELTLWASTTTRHYFLIPADITPSLGDYALRAVLDGRELLVSEAALLGFEVDEVAARRHVERALGPLAAEALGVPEQAAAPPADAAPDPRSLFDAVERDFGDLLDAPEERARREEQRRRVYRGSADAAIARSLLAHGINPIDISSD